MFTSLSRRGSRVNPSFVCSSCLFALVTHPDPQLLNLSTNRHPLRGLNAAFYSTKAEAVQEAGSGTKAGAKDKGEGKGHKKIEAKAITDNGDNSKPSKEMPAITSGRKRASMKRSNEKSKKASGKNDQWEQKLKDLKAAFLEEQGTFDKSTPKSDAKKKPKKAAKAAKVEKAEKADTPDVSTTPTKKKTKALQDEKTGSVAASGKNSKPSGSNVAAAAKKPASKKTSESKNASVKKATEVSSKAQVVVRRTRIKPSSEQSTGTKRLSLDRVRRTLTGHKPPTEMLYLGGSSSVPRDTVDKPILRMPRGGRVRRTKGSKRLFQASAIETIGHGKGMTAGKIETIDASNLKLVPVIKKQPPVPVLSYGLDRVLFNPGVYQLQDPRSRVFNFDPYLQTIMPVNEFDFTLLKKFITSSRDETLLQTTRDENKKYTGSTSSLTSVLAHFHYLLSQWRPINTGNLSKNFPDDLSTFTTFQRIPAAIFLRWKDGVYAIDSDKQYDSATVLSMLGQSMEKLLTLSSDDFEKYRKNSTESVSDENRTDPEAYHYTTMGDFLMRSQLDAYDPRIPGTGMFDLKTRAVVSIRMDTESYEQGRGYEIRNRHGEWESFEREYYDMIRAAFMKYSLQVRIGRMDGIFVAFHNTERIFGFQYISLPEMDYAIHGTDDTTLGESEFKISVDLFNRLLDRATKKWPERSIRLFFEARGKEDEATYMYVFARPIDDEVIEKIQSSSKAKIEEFEERVLGLKREQPETEEETKAQWEALQAKVQESIELDEDDAEDTEAEERDGGEMEEGVDVDERLPPSPWDVGGEDEQTTAEPADVIEDQEEVEADEEAEYSSIESEEVDKPSDAVDDVERVVRGEDATVFDENATQRMEFTEDQAVKQTSEVEHDANADAEQLIEDTAVETTQEEVLQDAGNGTVEAASEKASGGVDVDSPDDIANGILQSIIDEVDQNSVRDISEEFIDEDTNPEDEEIGGSGSSSLESDVSSLTSNAEASSAESVSGKSSFADSAAAAAATIPNPDAKDVEASEENSSELLAMYLTVRNKVNGTVVQRPENLTAEDKWTVEYAIAEITDPEQARNLFKSCKYRRQMVHTRKKEGESNLWNQKFMNSIRKYSDRGREYRKKLDDELANQPVKVLTVKPEDLKNWERWSDAGKRQSEEKREEK